LYCIIVYLGCVCSTVDTSLLSNIQKLFSEKIEIFSAVEFSKVSVLTGIVKISLKVRGSSSTCCSGCICCCSLRFWMLLLRSSYWRTSSRLVSRSNWNVFYCPVNG